MLDHADLLDKVFWFFLSGTGAYIAHSIGRLNSQIAVVISELGHHDKRLNRHDDDIKSLRK